MSEAKASIPNLIDRSVKLLFRELPDALLHLIGIAAGTATVRFEDTNLNLPELRADHVFIVEREGFPPFAIYLEYQLEPDPDLLSSWSLKWSALCRQLPMEVVLLVIYLEKGDRATFPASYQQSGAWLQTTLSFNIVRLWEHRGRIVSGEWPELAPLLVLCEAHPTEATLEQERELIQQSGLPRSEQAELLGIAMLLATRTFARTVIRSIFREEISMLDMEENLKELLLETGALQVWLQDPRISGELRAQAEAAGIAKGEAAGIAKGEAVGIAKGEAEALRRVTLGYLTRRFGPLPEALVAQITTADADWCQSFFDRAVTATSLSELTTAQ